MTQPSRVVHLRALPDATQEADISSFCSAWGSRGGGVAKMVALLLALVAALPLAAAAGPPPGPCPGCVPVFYAGLNGSKCFRIPTIIKSSRGTLLAFSENRITDCGDNGPHHDLVLRRSSDNGKTWGPMITVVHGKVPCPGCPAAVSNPNPLEVTLAGGAKALLLHYDTMNNPSAAHHGIDRQLWSHDDGLTWSDDTALSYPPEPNVGALIGPSVGLQSSKGTLYFSAVDDHFHFVYYSTDLGKSWKASSRLNATTAPLKTGDWSSSECSLAFLVDATDGRIMMNCRTGVSARTTTRWWSHDHLGVGSSCRLRTPCASRSLSQRRSCG